MKRTDIILISDIFNEVIVGLLLEKSNIIIRRGKIISLIMGISMYQKQ